MNLPEHDIDRRKILKDLFKTMPMTEHKILQNILKEYRQYILTLELDEAEEFCALLFIDLASSVNEGYGERIKDAGWEYKR
jgi:hypothetical protein